MSKLRELDAHFRQPALSWRLGHITACRRFPEPFGPASDSLTRRQRTDVLKRAPWRQGRRVAAALDADPVLDELTRTPFILSEVVSIFERGVPVPATKMGVLDAVIRLLEEAPEHSNELQVAPL